MPDRPPSPRAQFAALLSRFPPEIVARVKRCLPKLRRAFPVAYEIVYDYPHSLVVSFSMSERGYEAIVALSIDPRGVRLYFDKSLPDPLGLLKGSGSKVRSMTLASPSDLDRGEIRALIQAAITHSGAAFPSPRSTRMVFKTQSKKRNTGKTARRTRVNPSASE